jgi:diguanylate cyclase (GGDEF)-like protein
MHTSRDRVRAMLREQATHDPLTGLLNRRALQSHLDDAVKRLHRDNAAFAVIYIDLDGFKLVNDVHGHDVGDLLLIEASHRIQQRMQQDDLVGRIGGDEFALLIGSTPTHDDAEAMAQHLLDDIEWPFVIGEATITISASMGIAMASPANTQSTKELLGDADRAMYSVKKAEKGAFAFSA